MRKLNKEEYLPSGTGATVTFHSLKWDKRAEPFSLKAGGNIIYHRLTGKSTSSHTHDFVEIILVLSGKICHEVNGESKELSGGTLVFVRPTDTHCFKPIAKDACELVNFAFNLDILLEFSQYLGNDIFMRGFTAPAVPPSFKLSVVETETIAFELLKINNAAQINSVEFSRLKVKVIIAELFAKHFLEPKNQFADPTIPDWFLELCEKMRQPVNFIKGLEAMRAIACCSPNHLCKIFRKYLAQSPTEYINELRVNHAARLLSDGNEEIFAIATNLGFQSLSRFYHLFKKYYGVSPAKYRYIARKNDIPI